MEPGNNKWCQNNNDSLKIRLFHILSLGGALGWCKKPFRQPTRYIVFLFLNPITALIVFYVGPQNESEIASGKSSTAQTLSPGVVLHPRSDFHMPRSPLSGVMSTKAMFKIKRLNLLMQWWSWMCVCVFVSLFHCVVRTLCYISLASRAVSSCDAGFEKNITFFFKTSKSKLKPITKNVKIKKKRCGNLFFASRAVWSCDATFEK